MRNNKTFWVGLLFFFGTGLALSQPPDTLWTYVYDSPSPDIPFAISQTADGGFVVGGDTGFAQRGLLIRLDSEGQELWTWGYSDSLFVLFASIATRDGGFAVAGQQGPSRTLVIKMDSAGAVEWSDSLPAPSWAETALLETSDSGLVVLAVGGGLRLLRYSLEGDTLWTRTVVQSLGVGPASMVMTADHGFFLAGSLDRQVYVVKTDSLGFEEWSMVFGDRQLREEIYSASVTADGNYLVAGWQGNEFGEMTSPYMALVAWTGDTIWTRVYDELGLHRFHSVCALPEGDWVVGSESDSGCVVVRCNPDGNIVWSATCGGLIPTYYGATMSLTTDGGLAIAGYRLGLEFTEDIYVMRTASILHADPLPHVSTLSFTLLPNFPNPFNAYTTLPFILANSGRVVLSVCDITGRLVERIETGRLEAGHHQIVFNGEGLASGCYVYTLEQSAKTCSHKMILLR